jgi:hypothetical protein
MVGTPGARFGSTELGRRKVAIQPMSRHIVRVTFVASEVKEEIVHKYLLVSMKRQSAIHK